MRPSFPEYFMGVAEAVSARGDCTRQTVGALYVDRLNRIISTGYNGAAPGQPGCLTAGACPRGRLPLDKPAGPYEGAGACDAWHAEENAEKFAGESLKGARLFVTDKPCNKCYARQQALGVSEIYYKEKGVGEIVHVHLSPTGGNRLLQVARSLLARVLVLQDRRR